MKWILLLALFVSSSAFAEKLKIEFLPHILGTKVMDTCEPPDAGSCRVVDQSGTMDAFACNNSAVGSIRCYADVEYSNGARFRVWGGCASTYSDCWSSGSSHVDACN